MPEPSFASLSPTLLARKGGARPAMRPQHAAFAAMPAPAAFDGDADRLEDLGWNDMGDNDDHASLAEVIALTPMTGPAAEPHEAPIEPEVLRQRGAIAARIAPALAAQPARPARAVKPHARKNRAAFTLRLDAERHVRLRLACTMHGTSAQALVTEALDALLGTMPELESLAAQVKRR